MSLDTTEIEPVNVIQFVQCRPTVSITLVPAHMLPSRNAVTQLLATHVKSLLPQLIALAEC